MTMTRAGVEIEGESMPIASAPNEPHYLSSLCDLNWPPHLYQMKSPRLSGILAICLYGQKYFSIF